ncbi:DUF397 domain-containing protein [Saccharopolyspora phatthalungensis]|uniref:DUF397 domain-containing protein n=1 Tax=Saccharopolyspora phatthalungensis TaxID=664693 RepID=A0A840QI60_9PSEU|nr:DUF397 domain-containing protein [Saccharopolyspora phatthalungensis]MBB5159917.1 hypothetical protein [Saccharopolyspora phatthalungensis]
MPHSGAQWFKRSRSQTQDACVEAALIPGFAGVQDTKDPERKDRLVFSSKQWATFIENVKAGNADL